MAEICDLSFKRIQFTPDLMPSDITGTELIDIDPETEKRAFRFYRGPILQTAVWQMKSIERHRKHRQPFRGNARASRNSGRTYLRY